ncbi:TPA: GNAT family N-acetyltransferase [Legionella pneumophila]
MIIKQLTTDDWLVWKNIRLNALNDTPESFRSSFEEEVNLPDKHFQNTLSTGEVYGVFIKEDLVSCAGFYVLNNHKTKHRGIIWGVYTKPEYREQGIATQLIQTILKHCKSCVAQVHLACATTNQNAL